MLSEFDFVWQAELRRARERGTVVRQRVRQPRQHLHRDRQHAGQRLARAGRAVAVQQALPKGPSGEWLDAFGFANWEMLGMQWNVKAGQHTVLLGRQPAARRRGPRRVLRAELARPHEGLRHAGRGSEGAVPSEGRHHAADAGHQGPVDRGPVVLQLAGGARARVGQLPDRERRRCKFGGDSLVFGPNPFAAAIPGAPGVHALVEPAGHHAARDTARSLGDWGVSARWSPDWLDGTLGFYYRNATDILPQAIADAGLRAAAGGHLHGHRRRRAARPHRVHHQPERDERRRPHAEGQGRRLYNGAYGDNIHIFGVTLSKSIGGVSVGAELSYRQNMPLLSDPVQALPTPLVQRSRRADRRSTDVPPTARRARWATRTTASSTASEHVPEDAAVRHARRSRRAHLDALDQGDAERGGVQGPRQLHRRSTSRRANFFGLAINFTPTWFQVLPGVDVLAPIT